MTATTATETYRRETHAYNARRHGRPWIAKITDWSDPARPTLAFGTWVGASGASGVLILQGAVGQIVRYGQKDHRRADQSRSEYGVLAPNGTIDWRPGWTQADAYTAYLAYLANAPTE